MNSSLSFLDDDDLSFQIVNLRHNLQAVQLNSDEIHLDELLASLAVEQQKLASKQDALDNQIDRSTTSCDVELNLRGQVFVIPTSVLITNKDSYFFVMLASNEWRFTSNRRYFIDRPNEGFASTVHYLKTGEVRTNGLTEYETECFDNHLTYFHLKSPQKRPGGSVPYTNLFETFGGHGYELSPEYRAISAALTPTWSQWFSSLFQLRRPRTADRIDRKMHNARLIAFAQSISVAIADKIEESRCRLQKLQELEVRVAWHAQLATTPIIRLLLRGKVFEAYKSVLMKEGSYFSVMLSSEVWSCSDESNEYTIDRPSEGFDRILEYLSTGRLSHTSLSESELACLQENLDYFQLPLPVKFVSMPRELSGHKSSVYSLTEMKDGRLVSCSWDKTIRIWDVTTGECLRVLYGHSDYVFKVIQLEDGRLCSCSADTTIKMWDSTTFENTQSLHGHASTVRCVIQLKDGRLCTGSWDTTVKLWNISTGECVKTLEGHTDWVISLMQLSDGRVVSGWIDNSIRIWDTSSDHVIAIKSPGDMIIAFSFCELSDGRLVSSSIDNSIRIWNLSSCTCDAVIQGHTDQVLCVIALKDGRICSSSCHSDTTVRIWNVNTLKCESMLPREWGHSTSAWALLQLSDGSLCSASEDMSIKVWPRSTVMC